MKLDNMTDNRYKVNQNDVIDMREFRSLGFTVKEIADSYNISSATVVYWTNDKSRAKQKVKNAKRKRTKEENKNKIKKDIQKIAEEEKINSPETQEAIDYLKVLTGNHKQLN